MRKLSTEFLQYVIYATLGVFAIIIIAYFILKKQMGKSEYQQIKKLRQGTESNKFSKEVLYQKLYITYSKIPYIKTYINKLRRRLEILNVDDEYATRRDSAKILSKVLLIIIPIIVLSIIVTHSNYLLMSIILIFELFMIDAFIDGSVDSMDNNLLKEQLTSNIEDLIIDYNITMAYYNKKYYKQGFKDATNLINICK